MLSVQTIMIKPEVLVENHIPVQKVVQYPGDFIINFPGKPLCLAHCLATYSVVIGILNSLTSQCSPQLQAVRTSVPACSSLLTAKLLLMLLWFAGECSLYSTGHTVL